MNLLPEIDMQEYSSSTKNRVSLPTFIILLSWYQAQYSSRLNSGSPCILPKPINSGHMIVFTSTLSTKLSMEDHFDKSLIRPDREIESGGGMKLMMMSSQVSLSWEACNGWLFWWYHNISSYQTLFTLLANLTFTDYTF